MGRRARRRDRGWIAALVAVLFAAGACSSEDGAGAPPSAVPTATPYASLPAATIVAKAPPPTPPPSFTPPATTPTPAVERVTYQLAAGDNPSSVAERFGITVAELLRANNITNPATLQIGQTLVIPGVSPTVGGGASVGASPTPRATATAPPALAPPAGQTYVVRNGDNASSIAASFGTTVAQLATLNSTTVAALGNLQVGQQLIVPAAAGAATPTATATATPGGTATPPASGKVYVVQAGDTAIEIAASFGVTMAQLAAANGTTEAALGSLKVGQRLAIPLP